VRALELTAPIAKNPHRILPTVIEELAERFGAAPALLSDGERLTYRELAARSSRYARWALDQGLAEGEVVGLLMPNRPEYLAIWLGITRVGGVVALLNTNVVGAALAHCVDIVAPKHIIAAAELTESLRRALQDRVETVKIWAHGAGSDEFPRVDRDVELQPAERLRETERRRPPIDHPALYIYTSGTTGLPKAAKVSHFRLMQWSHWFAGMMDARASDRMYNCLPMYHSIGGVVATVAPLVAGGSVVLRRRFSAGRVWDDVVEWNCTLFQYIGEMCRYLVNSPPHPREREHRLRICCGNGLRLEVWNAFQRRFSIPQILEFYAATEGNLSLFNVEGRPGAIGRIPPFLAHRFPMAIVKFDVERDELARDGRGFCVRCGPNEVGEAIGRIQEDPSSIGGRFEGYSSREASEEKTLRDVFEPGDAWFRTGDLIRRDAGGYFYFVDRIGDTFRWKGENVSTAEVAETIAACPGVTDAVVYGVTLPGREGRAGMAAIVVGPGFDLVAFRRCLVERLPDYARPLFVRIRDEIETTATFKPKARDLSREGYDPTVGGDSVYVDDPVRRAFVRLDEDGYRRIHTGPAHPERAESLPR
jgi:fatty-acyl-CoA synthase